MSHVKSMRLCMYMCGGGWEDEKKRLAPNEGASRLLI